jgi:hypothetical protein
MPPSRDRFARFLSDTLPQWDLACPSRSTFYREEFLRCQECLDQQREHYSDRAVTDVEAALANVMAQLDRLSSEADADQIISRLLQQFDIVTGLSAWTDPRQVN